MKIKNIAVITSLLLGSFSLTYANSLSLNSLSDNVNSLVSNTFNDITNKDNTWGSQDRTSQWYAGIGVNAFASSRNSKAPNSGFNGVVGYNIDNYVALQYNQFGSYNGMFGGLAEGVINFSNQTMITPYAIGGFGYASLTNNVRTAWDVGGGIRFDVSKKTSLFVDYRYIETIGSNNNIGALDPSASGSVNMISTGINFYFGDSPKRMDTKIVEKNATNTDTVNTKMISNVDNSVPTINESDYVLPKYIKQCKGNYNLTENGVACYTVYNKNVTVHLDTKFNYNSYSLKGTEKQPIYKFVQFIKNNNISKINLKGYASKGKTSPKYKKYNETLSKMRAQAVKNYMVSLGLKSSSITIEGFGYSNPLVPNNSNMNKKYNQRVQVNVTAPLRK